MFFSFGDNLFRDDLIKKSTLNFKYRGRLYHIKENEPTIAIRPLKCRLIQ